MLNIVYVLLVSLHASVTCVKESNYIFTQKQYPTYNITFFSVSNDDEIYAKFIIPKQDEDKGQTSSLNVLKSFSKYIIGKGDLWGFITPTELIYYNCVFWHTFISKET